MNITTNPIEVNTQLRIRCPYCQETFASTEALDLHNQEKHPTDAITLDDIKDELEDITFDIMDSNVITNQPAPYVNQQFAEVPSNEKSGGGCCGKNGSPENDYQSYSYRPGHNPEGCCDCEGVDCDNFWYDCGICNICTCCKACCRACCQCFTNCDCDCDCDCDD